jgi:uncharacterized protein YfkK (UPF0435 family)
MFIQYLENPFLRPNEVHIKELHDLNFLTQLRDTCITRLAQALQAFYGDFTSDNAIDYLKEKTTSVRIIGGFLTKFVNATSDIDINVILKDQSKSKELQNYFRNEVNFRPLSDKYQYQVNYFSDISGEHIVKFRRYGIELLGNDIYRKEAEDVFLDKNMVVVEDFLSRKKLLEYFVTPIEKCINIVNKEIISALHVEQSTCDKLARIYPMLDRVGTKTFPEFSKLPKALTIYEYTQDNLRYKAINEDSEFHKIMVLAVSKKVDELQKYINENSTIWLAKPFTLKNVLEEDLYQKLFLR